jgi:hypothetical protein
MKYPGIALLLVALAGCGGGGGGGSGSQGNVSGVQSSGPDEPQVSVPKYTPPPMPTSEFGCNSKGPEKHTEITEQPGGIYFGTLFNCETRSYTRVIGMVSETGEFRFLSTDEKDDSTSLLNGLLQIDGDTFQSAGRYLSAQGEAGELAIDGLIQDGKVIYGRWFVDWGGYGDFRLTHSNETGSSLPATFQLPENITATGQYYESKTAVSWAFESEGRFSAEDAAGCEYVGKLVHSVPQHNVFELQLTVSGCAMAGSYTGLAAAWAAWLDEFAFTVSVDDGGGRALLFYVVGPYSSP